jgi:hypothetical protein
MKKAAVITCHNIKNYGSVFQTYATSRIFGRLGYNVEIIDYQRPGTDNKGFREKILQESHLAKKPVLKWIFPAILKPSFEKMEKTFDAFLDEYVNLTPETYYSEEDLVANCPDADIYISGSDQIWNSSINGRTERPYFLSFAPDDKIRISFASSFGKTSLENSEVEATRSLLEKYQLITTREESGTKIVNGLGLDSTAILDPTLWLKREEWEALAKPIRAPEKYVLVYQLHSNSDMDNYIREIQKRYGMPCLRIDFYYHYIVKSGKHMICPTPGQLIELIRNAEYVISDSFHMTVFSILFHKQFISIYSDNSYNDRIANVLKWLDLEQRHIESYLDFDTLKNHIDYSTAEILLTEKRSELEKWLADSMKKL